MKMHTVITAPSTVPSFEVLLGKMTPHFRYFAKRVLRLKGDDYDDVLQELSSIAYELYLSLVRKGKQAFYTPIMRYAIGRFKEGRRFLGSDSVDVLAERTRQLGRTDVCTGDILYSLTDRRANVTESIHFHIDFEDWYQKQSAKDKRIINLLAMGESPSDVARACDVSPAAITYRRRYYGKSWDEYIADNWEGGIA